VLLRGVGRSLRSLFLLFKLFSESLWGWFVEVGHCPLQFCKGGKAKVGFNDLKQLKQFLDFHGTREVGRR
jgi:hypothetical protein